MSPTMRKMVNSHWRMACRYEAGPYPGRLVFFRAIGERQASTAPASDPRREWGDVALGGIDAYDVPGLHSEMFRPAGLAAIAGELPAYFPGGKDNQHQAEA
jgi:hypothetical protein